MILLDAILQHMAHCLHFWSPTMNAPNVHSIEILRRKHSTTNFEAKAYCIPNLCRLNNADGRFSVPNAGCGEDSK